MGLSLLLLKMCLKKQMEYKLNFIFLCLAVAPIHLIQMVFSWIIAKSFGGFKGWDAWDLIFLYGMLLSSYSIAQVFFRRFRYLDEFVVNGTLDTYFLKPQPLIYNLIFYNLNIMEIFSQLLPSIVILILSCYKIQVQWNFLKVLVLVLALLGGTIIQMCIFWLIGIVSFWTTKSSSIEDLYFSFKEFLNYPIHVYGKNIVFFLTYIFPMAFINYYPSLYILERENNVQLINFLTFPVSLGMLLLVLFIWKAALKKYSGTGS